MVAKSADSWDEFYSLRSRPKLKDYSLEEIQRIINSGSISDRIKLSRNYYEKDGFYKRLILHYATLLKYNGLLIPNPGYGKELSTGPNQKKYWEAMNFIEGLGLSELLTRISLRALVDGCYYGIVLNMDKKNFVLMDLPTTYCTSRFTDSKGNDIIEFDVRYFYTIMDEEAQDEALKAYPKFISSYFRKYDKGKVTSNWIALPSEMGVCFAFSNDMQPLLMSVIPATIQYDDAVDTERMRDAEEIRKIIVQKIPHLNDGQLVFEPDEAVEMHAGAVEMMRGNANLSILTTYADVDAIVSKTSADNATNSIEKMMQNIYATGGASSQLFAPTGGQALGTSITNDMALMMMLATKYSRFITFILNSLFANSNLTFSYEILPITWYNQSDYITDALKLAQSGYSFLLPGIAMGLSQLSLVNVKSLENDVLKLGEVLLPLSTSYTQSGSESAKQAEDEEEAKEQTKTQQVDPEKKGPGAPEKDLEDKAEKTIQNENAIDNQGGSK